MYLKRTNKLAVSAIYVKREKLHHQERTGVLNFYNDEEKCRMLALLQKPNTVTEVFIYTIVLNGSRKNSQRRDFFERPRKKSFCLLLARTKSKTFVLARTILRTLYHGKMVIHCL